MAVFRRKYVKPETPTTTKQKWHKLVFDPNTTKMFVFLEIRNQGAGKVFGENARSMIDSLFYAKTRPNLKHSVNKARFKNAKYDEFVTHLERELELNGLEEADDTTIPKNDYRLLSIPAQFALKKTGPCQRRRRDFKGKEVARQLKKTIRNAKHVINRFTGMSTAGKAQGHAPITKTSI